MLSLELESSTNLKAFCNTLTCTSALAKGLNPRCVKSPLILTEKSPRFPPVWTIPYSVKFPFVPSSTTNISDIWYWLLLTSSIPTI